MGYDRRIAFDVLEPGPGWGGSCLPKDTRALIRICEDAGYDFSLLRGAIAVNEEQQRRVVAKIEAMAGGSLAGVTVAAWGLTFKAGTDDRRHSPAIAIIDRLTDAGARVRAYDPTVRRAMPGLEICLEPYGACRDASVLAVLTEWDELRRVDFDKISSLMASPCVVDARNLARPRHHAAGRVPLPGDRPAMRVIVTGGAGFLGSHLCERLIDRGDEVVCVDNFITGSVENLAHVLGRPGFSLRCQDVSVSVEVPGAVDSIFHLASLASPRAYLRHPIETLTAGSLGTRNCLELAKAKRARFVLASTSEVYGNPQVHPQTENYWGYVNPIGFRSVYDEAKRFSESMTMAYHRTFGLDVRIARIFNTYGPRLRPVDGRVVSSLLTQALEGRPLTVYGDGTQTRSFCYVDDEVRAILALERSSATGPVNIGNPAEITLLDLADQVLAVTGSSSPIVFKPLPQDDPVRRRPDITLARTLLHWEPTVDLAEGLYRTRDWLVASGFRCRSNGRGSGFIVILGDGTDIPGAVAGLGVQANFVGEQDRLAGLAGQQQASGCGLVSRSGLRVCWLAGSAAW